MSRQVGAVAPPIAKSLFRRPTLVRKRDEDGATPSSPEKRVKVSFASDVEERVVDEWQHTPELVQDEVRRAFEKRGWGDRSGYDKIKDIFAPHKDTQDVPSSTTLRNYTMALLANVSSLNKSSSDLVDAVLNSEWLGRQEDYVLLYVRMLASLVSAQGMFLGSALRMLVENLTASPPSNGRLPELPNVSRSEIYARTHKALRYLLQLIPSASRVLSSVLASVFPHQIDSRRAHIVYTHNLLKLLDYAPELRAEVLALITERLVKIDVQVQVDLEDLAEEVGDGLVQKIPQVRPDLLEEVEDAETSGDESSPDEVESEFDEDEDDADAQRTKDITRNVEKMDAMLDILFTYYDQAFSGSSIENQIGTIDVLLSHFVTIILPTHRSRHTQFLFFHFAQQSPTYIDTFVGTCVQITFDRGQPAIVRQAAAAYLASFVARGMHVPANIVRDVFDYIGSELNRLRQEYEAGSKGPDLRRYSSFYCLVQALLYIFCFRWRDLESNPYDYYEDDDLASTYGQDHQWKSGVKEALALNIFSKLNPLKVCSPVIVTEFARVANHLGVVYVYHLLETNKRIRLSQFSGITGSGLQYDQPDRESALSASRDESHYHLDEYFPFDPYHLPKSKRWIEGEYREWIGIPGLDDKQESESGSEEGEAVGSEGTETDEAEEPL